MSRKEIRILVNSLKLNQLKYLIQYAVIAKFNITKLWYLDYLDE